MVGVRDMIYLWLQWGRNFIVAEMSTIRTIGLSTTPGFNGAATLSLRKSSIAFAGSMTFQSLQWGRNFIVAEIRMPFRGMSTEESLQWGRNFIVAEIVLSKFTV